MPSNRMQIIRISPRRDSPAGVFAGFPACPDRPSDFLHDRSCWAAAERDWSHVRTRGSRAGGPGRIESPVRHDPDRSVDVRDCLAPVDGGRDRRLLCPSSTSNEGRAHRRIAAGLTSMSGASRKSSIFLRRIVSSMFMRVNSKCAHHLRPPVGALKRRHAPRDSRAWNKP